MTLLPILRFPHPGLRLPAAPVVAFDAALRRLAEDLTETLRAAPGVGITAPHVGIPQRLAVLDLAPEHGPEVFVNPEILWFSEEKIRHAEGSLSMPGVTEELERPARIRLRWRDLDGLERTEEAEGFRAICHQHEIDQLDGIFWIQRLSKLRRDRLVKKYEKLRRTA